MAIGMSGANIVDIRICINIFEELSKDFRIFFHALPPLSLFDRFLVGNHPIVAGLFSLKTAKKMVILMDNEARFEQGVANVLEEAFMKEGTAYGRSITIVRRCLFPHRKIKKGKPCPRCGRTKVELVNGSHWDRGLPH